MQYPLISEYITAIRSGEDTFDKLSHLRPVLDDTGNPVMSSGNFAVVFKMTDGTKLYALKCFLKEQSGRDEAYKMITEELEDVSSTYIIHIAYFEKELFVDTHNCQETEFPVLLMDWVDGLPLDIYLKNHLNNSDDLKLLAYRFCNLAGWLLTQPFAHGDIKPDNILVDAEGNLILVDYDGMYVPKMAGQQARELGSPDYCHPYRTKEQFDEHIDDFSLAVIALSLKAISLDVSLLDCKTAGDGLLFSAKDYFNLAESDLFKKLPNLFYDNELEQLYALFLLVHSSKFLPDISYNYFNIKKPDVSIYKEGELVIIPEGTKIIEARQFKDNKRVKCVIIPDGVIEIGEFSFYNCTSLQSIEIPDSVTKIGILAFGHCTSLEFIKIPNNINNYETGFLNDCNKKIVIESERLTIKDGMIICDSTLISCLSGINHVIIPNDVITIGRYAFYSCTYIQSVVIPSSVIKIRGFAFAYCKLLQAITITNGVTEIESLVFSECISLQNIIIPESVVKVGAFVFWGCTSLRNVFILNNNIEYQGGTFNNSSVDCIIGASNLSIGRDGTVVHNSTLISCLSTDIECIKIPYGVKKISFGAFYGCESICNIVIPASVTEIGARAFRHCSSLQTITIPENLSRIGDKAFMDCVSLQYIEIFSITVKLGKSIFLGCTSLQKIYVPRKRKQYFLNLIALAEYKDKIEEMDL